MSTNDQGNNLTTFELKLDFRKQQKSLSSLLYPDSLRCWRGFIYSWHLVLAVEARRLKLEAKNHLHKVVRVRMTGAVLWIGHES